MIRRYPELCARQEELRRTKMSPNLTGMPGAHGQTSDPVADAALRELPEINRRELEAVRQAIEETRALPNGEERLEMVKLVFWKKTHTLEGVAIKCYISYPTAKRWHKEFILLVGENFGLL
nr:MAG TPA: transcriptional activator [Caudoviricetes sp.]